jgi:hypothetical protein
MDVWALSGVQGLVSGGAELGPGGIGALAIVNGRIQVSAPFHMLPHVVPMYQRRPAREFEIDRRVFMWYK